MMPLMISDGTCGNFTEPRNVRRNTRGDGGCVRAKAVQYLPKSDESHKYLNYSSQDRHFNRPRGNTFSTGMARVVVVVVVLALADVAAPDPTTTLPGWLPAYSSAAPGASADPPAEAWQMAVVLTSVAGMLVLMGRCPHVI